jgi:hypothetical protein
MAAQFNSLARAALLGLILGLAGAALIFVGHAWTNSTQDCTFPDTEECAFELSNAREVGRLQGFAAVGCALIAGGLALAVRRR